MINIEKTQKINSDYDCFNLADIYSEELIQKKEGEVDIADTAKISVRLKNELPMNIIYDQLISNEFLRQIESRKRNFFHCLSPSDRNGVKYYRIEALYLKSSYNNSLDCNRSYPCISRKRNDIDETNLFESLPKFSLTMDRIRVDGPNGIRFSAKKSRGCFTPDSSSLFGNNTSQISESIRISQSSINPNKAVFTIDAKSTDILIVNSNACSLLGYSSKELCEMKLLALLHNRNQNPASALAEGQFNSEDGSMVLLSGKVVEMIRKNGSVVPVSLWIRQLEHEGPCVAVAEPVQRRVAQLTIDRDGYITSADAEAVLIFQCDIEDQLVTMDIKSIIPSILLPELDLKTMHKHIRKQKATGRTLDGFTFPLCLILSEKENLESLDSEVPSDSYTITVWVFSNLSGLVVMNEDGIVECVNHHFTMLLFGHPQSKVIGHKITQIIPNFGEDFEYIEFNHSRNVTISSVGNSDTENDSLHMSHKLITNFSKHKLSGNSDKMQLHESQYASNINISNLSIEFTVPKSLCNGQIKPKEDLQYFQDEDNKSCPAHNIIEDITDNIVDSIKVMSFEEPTQDCITIDKNNLHLILNSVKTTDDDLLTPVNKMVTKINNDLENILNISNTSLIHEQADNDDAIIDKNSHFHMNLVLCEDDDELRTPINEANTSQSAENIEKKERKEQSRIYIVNDSIDNSTPSGNVTPVFKRCKDLIEKRQHMSTSTPENKEKMLTKNRFNFKEGRYKGFGTHADGNSVDIQYVVLKQTIPQNRNVFCVWVSLDPQDLSNQENYTLTSSFNSTVEQSLGQAIKQTATQNQTYLNSVSLMSQCEEEQTKGEYNQNYTTLRQIGKGAYGYVKMAYRNSDRLLVISKFILKERVNEEFWVWDKEMGRNVPLEISLLSTLSHPNIVRIYDIYENEKFFQLIMEKHGSGMDLFEFIDRMPMLDEPLISYIFRQIASAVEYLHSLQILHRDIKDENVIIDHKFDVKLIDFGSATFFKEDSEFSTFYGTTEYCSPEVLAGNKYSGPELEIWSMGITLFVLAFCVNPFEDIEETLHGTLSLPCKVSQGLEQLLFSMLCKEPAKRCTVQELMSSQWLNQPIDITKYDFAQIVTCDLHEVQPEQYYTVEGYCNANYSSSDIATPQETGFITENNTSPTGGFSQTDIGKSQLDSKENTDNNVDIINFKFENVESEEINHSVEQLPDSLGNLDTFDYDYDSWDEEDSCS